MQKRQSTAEPSAAHFPCAMAPQFFLSLNAVIRHRHDVHQTVRLSTVDLHVRVPLPFRASHSFHGVDRILVGYTLLVRLLTSLNSSLRFTLTRIWHGPKVRLACDNRTRRVIRMSSGSESEGEIIETEAEKATTALPSVNGISVDRQSRSRLDSASRSSRASPDSGSERHRSRSPFRHRSPRGEKRRRDDDFYDERDRPDPRRFRVYYEGRRPNGAENRRRNSYVDLDRSDAPPAAFDYDDRDGRDRYRDRRDWQRSRSPDAQGRKRGRKGWPEREDRDPHRNMQDHRQRDGRDKHEKKGKNEPVSERRSLLSDNGKQLQATGARDDRAGQNNLSQTNGFDSQK